MEMKYKIIHSLTYSFTPRWTDWPRWGRETIYWGQDGSFLPVVAQGWDGGQVAEPGRQPWVPLPSPAPPLPQGSPRGPASACSRRCLHPTALSATLGLCLWVLALSVPLSVSASVCLCLPLSLSQSLLLVPVSVSHTQSLPQGRRQAPKVCPTPCCTYSRHTACSRVSHSA